jgi:hypothetical protein
MLKGRRVASPGNGLQPVSDERGLRTVAVRRVEEILSEVAPTLRQLRTFLLVATISAPLFLTGLIVVLWRLAH